MTTTEEQPAPPEEAQEEPAEAPQPPSEALALPEPATGSPLLDLPTLPGSQELRDLAATAVTLAAGTLVPQRLQGRPNDVFLVLLTGRDLGIKITTALRELHVIEGRITLSPKVRLAMLRERPDIGRAWPDPGNHEWQATWYGERADSPGVRYASTFNWDDAQRVVIKTDQNGKPTKFLSEKDNWRNYPKRMLSWRALGFLMDDAFGEIGTGLYQPDELGAVTNEEGEPIEVIDIEPLADGMAGRRARQEAPPPLAAEEAVSLQLRAQALPEGSRAEFFGFWRDQAKLPKIAELAAHQASKASAAIEMFEKRAEKGEWGPWPPKAPDPEGSEGGATAEAGFGEVAGPSEAPPSEKIDEAMANLEASLAAAKATREAKEPAPGCPHPADEWSVTPDGTFVCTGCGEAVPQALIDAADDPECDPF